MTSKKVDMKTITSELKKDAREIKSELKSGFKKTVGKDMKKAKKNKAEGNYGLVNMGMEATEKKPVGSMDLLRIASGLIGTSFSESFLVAFLGPYTAELGERFSSKIWLIVPLTSIFVQPAVGAWSDHCKWRAGRRRPYLLLGTLVLAAGQLLVGTSEEVALRYSFAPFTIFMFAICIFNIGLSIQQVSLRALWAEVVPAEQLPIVFSAGTFFQLGGYMLGYATTEVRWSETLFFSFLKTSTCNGRNLCFDVRVVSLMLASISWIANVLTLITAEEPILGIPRDRGCCAPIINILASIKESLSSGFVRRVVECNFFSWIGWWLFNIYVVHFVASEVFRGLADAPTISHERKRYEQGVHFASGSLFLTMIVGWITAVFVPSITNVCGSAASWASSFLLAAGMLLLAALILHWTEIQGKEGIAALWIAAFGIPFAFQITIPFILILGSEELRQCTGVLVALLTMSIAIAQLLVASFGSEIKKFAGTDVSSFGVGALALVIAAARCVWLSSKEFEFSLESAKHMREQPSPSRKKRPSAFSMSSAMADL